MKLTPASICKRRRVSFMSSSPVKTKRIQYKKSITIENGCLKSAENLNNIVNDQKQNKSRVVSSPAIVEIDNPRGNTEVERRLNYNLLPNKHTQKKLDYYA